VRIKLRRNGKKYELGKKEANDYIVLITFLNRGASLKR
jgi:hypothetical protein